MRWVSIYGLVGEAARSFDAIIEEKTLPKVGIVGEIYLKFNSSPTNG